MSFFKAVCPWCGAEWMTGMVGRAPVGGSHECEAVVPCDEEGCDAPSAWYCCSALGQDGPVGPSFRCDDHLDDKTILMHRPR